MPPNLLAHYLYLWELTAVRQAVETAWISASVRRTFIELLVPAGSSSSLGQGGLGHEARRHRSWQFARDEVAGVVIGAVGIDLARHSEAQVGRCALELGAGHQDIDQLGVDRGDGPADREHRWALDCGEISQRAVRLDVADAIAEGARHPLQCADLVDDHLFDVLGLLALDLAAAKTPDIKKARMSAYPNTVLLGAADGVKHDQRIAAVKTASDIRRGHDLQHLGVAAHGPGAKALAHVAIQVDQIHRGRSRFSVLLIWEEFAAQRQLDAIALGIGLALDRHV